MLICRILFTHSSFDGYLGHFHFLAVFNNAAMNIHVHGLCICIVFLFVAYLGVESLVYGNNV